MVSEHDYVAIHLSPLRGELADFKIFAKISEGTSKREWEQLWVRNLGNQDYEICCIPFFVYDLAVGDVVKTDDRLVLQETVRRSGHSTIRVWFGGVTNDTGNEFSTKLHGLGFGVEWNSKNLLAIDCVNALAFERAVALLKNLAEEQPIEYEFGERSLQPK